MKLVKLKDLKGNEILARPIMTSNYTELLAAGTILKKEYVSKIEMLGIDEVMIEENVGSLKKVLIMREDVKSSFREKVKSVIERHVYSDNKELKELTETADSIITNILDNDEVVERIYDIRERSADIYEHSISVCSIAVLVAAKLRLSKEQMHDIGVASLFHDIGLRYLNFKYCEIDLDALTNKELAEYKKHPVYAFTSLENEPWISKNAKLMILNHHERLDGSGYPMHAKSMEIDSRILEVVDAFDEMICGIGCKRSRVYEAVEYLKAFKGKIFDENVVNTLLDFTAVYPAGSIVLLDTGETAVVERQNKQFPERPVLKIIKDAEGNSLSENKECDLLEVHNICIEKVIM